ncbi:MAG: hypothetical protein KC593_25790 [Myxococcales bacterium]|nr:hypothetical protein [Myxococcales bacterium]
MSCGGSGPCASDGALAACSSPMQAPDHYVDQALRYFDSYDASADPTSRPTYAEGVIRWEWPPWLILTGYGRDLIVSVDSLVLAATPSTIPTRDCRAFTEQPFARCRVSFQYDGGPCAIYEEFTFNDLGEITFVEAWSDLPEYLPMDDPAADPWGEGPGVRRLSTRVPGLGTPLGVVDPLSEAMQAAAAEDADVAELASRMQTFWTSWLREFNAIGANGEAAIYGPGCGWAP